MVLAVPNVKNMTWESVPNPYSFNTHCDKLDNYLEDNEKYLFQRHYRIHACLSESIPAELLNNSAILIIGSDARLENAPAACQLSPLQLLIIGHSEEDASRIRDIIQGIIKSVGAFEYVDFRVGNKIFQPNDDLCLSGFEANPRRAWPDRILDSIFLLGSEHVMQEAVERVHQEWGCKDVRESVKENLRKSLRLTESGVQRGDQHFDLSTGALYFDPERHIRGLKLGPIRTLQIFFTIKRLTEGMEFSSGLHSNSTRKMKKVYPGENDTALAYKKALSLYHYQQSLRCDGESGYLEIDAEELGFISQTISEFVQREMRSL